MESHEINSMRWDEEKIKTSAMQMIEDIEKFLAEQPEAKNLGEVIMMNFVPDADGPKPPEARIRYTTPRNLP